MEEASTGVETTSQARASEPTPRFGWHALTDKLDDPEDRVVLQLSSDGFPVVQAGSRHQSFDLSLASDHGPLSAGKYEVKSLWRRNENRMFDRRFKVAGRGERIYGRRDAEIKAFLRGLEDELEALIEYERVRIRSNPSTHPTETVSMCDGLHDLIDAGFERRHSRSFQVRLGAVASLCNVEFPVSQRLKELSLAAQYGSVKTADILRGYQDIEGIFIVAGPIYTLVTKDEIGEHIRFDSASAEGPKLRLVSVIPSEKPSYGRKKRQ